MAIYSEPLMIFVIVPLLLAVQACGPSESELREAAAKKAQEAEKLQIDAFKATLIAPFRDPDSAQFRNVRLLADAKGLCGEVNAKDTSGGYVGYMPFAVTNDGKRIVFMHMPAVELRNVANKTKAETHDYIMKAAAQLFLVGGNSQAGGIISELIEMERFEGWRECFR